MMSSDKTGIMRKTSHSVLALVLGAGLCLSGCGGGDEQAEAVRKAKLDMQTLATTNVPGAKGSDKVSYQKVITDLSKAADSSNAGVATAARVLRARAYTREGDDAAVRVGELERRAQSLQGEVRTYHNHWLDLNAQAAGLRKYDASVELARLDEQQRKLDEDIKDADSALAAAEAELASLRARADAALEQARSLRDEELAIRNRMIDRSQTERAELVKMANETKRKGDGLDREAADLGAEAAKARPNIAQLRLQAERLRIQKTMLEASREQVVKAAEMTARQAERALGGGRTASGEEVMGAAQAAEAIHRAVAELKEVRAGLGEPTDEADRFYSQAMSEAQKIKSGGGGPGAGGNDSKLTKAQTYHAQAGLHLMRAQGLQGYADLLRRLAETKPALPHASEYAAQSDEAANAAKELLTKAEEEFTQARDLYESAGVPAGAQDVKDRLEMVVKTLASFTGRAPTEPAEPSENPDIAQVPAATDAATAPTEPMPSFEGAQAEVFALLQKIEETIKAKNYEAMMPLLLFRNSQQEENFRKILPLMVKEDALNAACMERFGRSFDDLVLEYAKQQGGVGDANAQTTGYKALTRLRSLDPADLNILIVAGGREAEITYKSAPALDPLIATNRNGTWVLQFDFELEGGMSAEMFLKGMEGVYDKVIENIKSGRYENDSAKMIEDFGMLALKSFLEQMKPKDDENK